MFPLLECVFNAVGRITVDVYETVTLIVVRSLAVEASCDGLVDRDSTDSTDPTMLDSLPTPCGWFEIVEEKLESEGWPEDNMESTYVESKLSLTKTVEVDSIDGSAPEFMSAL